MPARTPLHVRRHYGELCEKETDAVVGILADLIVTYLKKKRSPVADPMSASAGASRDETVHKDEVPVTGAGR